MYRFRDQAWELYLMARVATFTCPWLLILTPNRRKYFHLISTTYFPQYCPCFIGLAAYYKWRIINYAVTIRAEKFRGIYFILPKHSFAPSAALQISLLLLPRTTTKVHRSPISGGRTIFPLRRQVFDSSINILLRS